MRSNKKRETMADLVGSPMSGVGRRKGKDTLKPPSPGWRNG